VKTVDGDTMRKLLTRAGIAAVLSIPQLAVGAKSPEMAEMAALHQKAVAAQNAGHYEEAERLHRQVVEAIAGIPDFAPNEEARQLSNLASVLNLRGKHDEALNLLERAQGLLAKNPSRDPAQYSTLHFNFGRNYALRGQWTSAEQRYKEGIEVLTKAGVTDRAYFFEGDAGLGYVYWKSGRLAEAKSRYESALRFVGTLVPPTHPVRRRWEQDYQAVIKELER
jgi:tetratricopeptide (TPR) repeat protein